LARCWHGALVLFIATHLADVERFGFPKNLIIFVLGCLFFAFIGFFYAHLATLDFYRQCGEFRVQLKLGSSNLVKLREKVHASWKVAYWAIQGSHALIGIAGFAALSGVFSSFQ
jgi:hypothetical protein